MRWPQTMPGGARPTAVRILGNKETTPMDTEEAYKELSLDPSASDEQLKATWRRLVATWQAGLARAPINRV